MNIDQETWDVLDQVTATYSMNKIRLSADVGLGTHFIKIQHINGSDALDVNGESVQWKIPLKQRFWKKEKSLGSLLLKL